jgi:hypothetical protein
MMLPFLACAAGIYLGLHFNILALLPFSILGAGAFIVSGWAAGQSFFDNASTLLFPMILVQAGYMLGLTAREPYGQLLARMNIGQSRRI